MNKNDEMKLRELLWLRHGCNVSTLYGDDGEMQCGQCGIDFKRFSPYEIATRFEKNAWLVNKILGITQKDKGVNC